MKKFVSGKSGFTLIEVIVVAAIIAILAGILVPMIFNQIDESRITRATGDTKSIASALQVFRKDNGKWPNYASGTYPCTTAGGGDGVLFSMLNTEGGNMPSITGAGWADPGTSSRLKNVLQQASGCYPVPASANVPGFKGPYMSALDPDPWGNNYVVNAQDFDTAGAPVWVISAGPNGVIETAANAKTPAGDDIGTLVKQ